MDDLTKQAGLGQEDPKGLPIGREKDDKASAVPIFRNLESWDLARGEEVQDKKDAFLEEAVRKQAEYNMRLQEKVQKTVPQREVAATASVSEPPVQRQVLRESWKQRLERQRKLKLARKLCPVGDEITLDVGRSVAEMRNARENCLAAAGINYERAKQTGVDIRILRAFCRGHRKNRKGKPETEADEAAMKEDMKFLEDYLSGEEVRRLPHLRRAVGEILQMRFTPEMLSPEFVFRNISALIDTADKLACIESMIKENPIFFNNLPPLERDLIAADAEIASHLSGYLTAVIGAKGVCIDDGSIYGEEQEQLIRAHLDTLDQTMESFSEAVGTFRESVNAAFDKEIDRKYEDCRPGIMLGCLQMEDRLRRERDPRASISFTSSTVSMALRDYVFTVRKLIEENAGSYGNNRDLIEKLYAEFFKCSDTMAGIVFDMTVLQTCCGEYDETQPGYKRDLAHAFAVRQEELLKRHSVLQKRAEALKNVIEHFLTGAELSPMGSEIMKEYADQQLNIWGGENPWMK